MRIKHFTAPNMTQAMRQVREELGPDAVILSTGKSGGMVEIAAAVDADAPPRPKAESKPSPQAEPRVEFSQGDLQALAQQVANLSNQLSIHMLHNEAAGNFSARPEVAPLFAHLSQQEVAPEIIESLLQDMSSPQGHGLLPRLAIRIKKMLQVSTGPEPQAGGSAIWALVGPTGVGKTTTVAKLAANYGLKQGLKVGLITLDTFRIAAAEQLKVYGQIMQLPIIVAGNSREYQRALDELSGCELVVVDTVGRAPGDEGNLLELRSILAAGPQTQNHLVLACPTRDADQARVAQAFGQFNPKSLIFTKVDETSIYGPILNQVRRTGLPVSFLTTGQKVPDDFEHATLDGLARLLMPRPSPRE